MRILIVEDDAPLRRCLVQSLTVRAYQVDAAASRAAAIDALDRADYGLILLDVSLPDGTGWDVLRQLAVAKRPPPTVIVSPVPPSPRRISAFRPLAVLQKPFPIDAIVRLIERVDAARGQEQMRWLIS